MGDISGAGGTTTSFSNTPQAKDDGYQLAEDFLGITFFDVMSNDLGGNAKTLFSIDNGTNQSGAMSGYSAADLLTQDTGRAEATSGDTSAKGAKIWITSDGKIGYDAATLTAAFKAAVQGLHSGETLTDTFIYSIRLGNGTLSWATVTVTFLGANDNATISIVAGGDYCVTEAGGAANAIPGDPIASGQLAISDVDAGDNKFQTPPPASLNGTYGTWTFNNLTGQWTYTLDNSRASTQALNAGDVTTETLTVTSWDGSASSTITVQVKGSNDNASIAVVPGGDNSVTEAGGGNDSVAATPGDPTAGGQLTVSDVDDGEDHFQTPPSLAGTYGTFTFNPTTGVWGYTLANGQANVQALNAGDIVHDLLTVTSADGTASYTIDVTVTGANDAATITGDVTGDVAEDGDLTASGTLFVADVDDGEAELQPIAAGTPGDNGYGTFQVDANGAWGYTLNNGLPAVQGLGEGDTLTDTITVTSEDGTDTQVITVTITGDGDAPVITAGNDVGAVGEDATLVATGNLDATDIDVGDDPTWSAGAATHGTASIDAVTGEWTYTLDNASAAVQGLGEGDVLADSFQVTVTDEDGLTDTVTVNLTITGDGDAPVITAGNDVGAVGEDATLVATGNLDATDIDVGDDPTWSAGAATHGTASIDAVTGEWTYTLDNASAAVQGLGEGDVLADSFQVTVTDEDGLTDTVTVNLTITGDGDAPVITAGNDVGAVGEDATLVATGNLDATDIDVGDDPTWSAGAATHGTASIDAVTGEWTYTLDNASAAVQGLGEGDVLADSFQVTVTDEDGLTDTVTVNLTITGDGDAPVITAGNDVGAVGEDATLVATGNLDATDIDVGDDPTWSAGAATHGTASIDAVTGEWTYTLDNASAAVQGLGEGDVLADSFQVTVTDEDGLTDTVTVNLTITGDGDAPVITAGNDVGAVGEDATLVATGNLDATDIDVGDDPTWSAGAATHGTASIDAVTGEWTYTLDNASAAVQGLGEGDVLADSFQVTVTDEDGLTDTVTVNLTITGDGDAPVITAGNDVGAVGEDATLVATGNLDATDIDVGDDPTWSAGAATHGTASIDAVTGEWTYTLDNASAAVQGLGEGDVLADSFQVTVTDEDGLTDTVTVNLTITGDGDAPVITAGNDVGAVGEDATLVATGNLDATDIDVGDDPTWSAGAATHGTASIDAVTGEWTYTLDNASAAVQGLGEGDVLADSFQVTVTDEDGLTDTVTVNLTITGDGDAPVITAGNDVGAVGEDATLVATGNLDATDIDVGDDPTWSAGAATHGTASIDAVTGEWTYTLDNASAAVQGLGEGDVLADSFQVTVTDEDGLTDTVTVNLTITGDGDAPVITAGNDVGAVGEDATLVATGNLDATDIDVGDDPSWSAGAATHGTASIDAVTGEWTYTLDNASAAVQGLGEGDVLADSFQVTVTDEDGLTDTVTVNLTITGADDQPTLAAVTSGSVSEIDQSSSRTSAGLNGTLVGNDVDGDTPTYGIQGGGPAGPNLVSLTAVFGTLTVNTVTGAYTYTPNASAIEALDAGETPSDVFNVTVNDGTGPDVVQTYTVNLTGADDAPTLAPVTSGSVAEVPNSTSTTDSGLSGTLVGADVDVETLAYGIVGGAPAGVNQVSLDGTYGTLTVNTATGAYSYAKNAAAIEALNAGQNPSDVFTVTVNDGDGPTVNQTYTVNITGADDGPVGLAPTDIKFSLNEANAQAQSGNQLNANTVLGTFTAVDADSSTWTFTLTGTGAASFALSPASGLQSSVGLVVGTTSVTSGDYVLTVTATDSNGNSKVETFTVHVGTTGADTTFAVTSGTEIDFGLNGGDILMGGGGDDALVGGQNNDTIEGGLGADELLGGGNNDNFDFIKVGADGDLSHYGIDRILDMNDGNDTIRLDDALFAGIGGPGSLSATVLSLTGAPVDANDRIIYNSVTGALSYDADGNGAGAAIQFAQLDAGTVLALADFVVI